MNEQVLRKVETFFSTYKEQLYRKGEILVRADENPTGVFYLKEGVVKEYALSQKGDELIVNTFKKCSFFPMSWALNQTSNTYFFEAATPIQIQLFSKGYKELDWFVVLLPSCLSGIKLCIHVPKSIWST